MNATYTTREGERWELRRVAPIRFAPGFWYGERVDNGRLVQVHEHRLIFHETLANQPQEQTPAPGALRAAGPVQTTNPS